LQTSTCCKTFQEIATAIFIVEKDASATHGWRLVHLQRCSDQRVPQPATPVLQLPADYRKKLQEHPLFDPEEVKEYVQNWFATEGTGKQTLHTGSNFLPIRRCGEVRIVGWERWEEHCKSHRKVLRSEVLSIQMIRPLGDGTRGALVVCSVAETYLCKGVLQNYITTHTLVFHRNSPGGVWLLDAMLISHGQTGNTLLQIQISISRLLMGAAYRVFQGAHAVCQFTSNKIEDQPYTLESLAEFSTSAGKVYKAINVYDRGETSTKDASRIDSQAVDALNLSLTRQCSKLRDPGQESSAYVEEGLRVSTEAIPWYSRLQHTTLESKPRSDGESEPWYKKRIAGSSYHMARQEEHQAEMSSGVPKGGTEHSHNWIRGEEVVNVACGDDVLIACSEFSCVVKKMERKYWYS